MANRNWPLLMGLNLQCTPSLLSHILTGRNTILLKRNLDEANSHHYFWERVLTLVSVSTFSSMKEHSGIEVDRQGHRSWFWLWHHDNSQISKFKKIWNLSCQPGSSELVRPQPVVHLIFLLVLTRPHPQYCVVLHLILTSTLACITMLWPLLE